jgi:hypothetical protein
MIVESIFYKTESTSPIDSIQSPSAYFIQAIIPGGHSKKRGVHRKFIDLQLVQE